MMQIWQNLIHFHYFKKVTFYKEEMEENYLRASTAAYEWTASCNISIHMGASSNSSCSTSTIGSSCMFSQVCLQGVGVEEEQLGLKLVLIWDACVSGSKFNQLCYNTSLYLSLSFYLKSELQREEKSQEEILHPLVHSSQKWPQQLQLDQFKPRSFF